ncbi:hypothetical protein I4U23_027946 [Adineta vaga]|nr:hypothetical protein I4U23_027946 [Adineta vaga]
MNWVLIITLFSLSSAVTLINNAKFNPDNRDVVLSNITGVNSQFNCICLCFSNSKCLTAMYSAITQRCILYLASLNQGTLTLMTTNAMTSVFTFRNKTLPAPSSVTSTNETVYGIWNTSAGHDSFASTSGTSSGNYVASESPINVFDGNLNTKYINFGSCNATFGLYDAECGVNTGLYVSLRRGPSLLQGFVFGTANSFPARDPLVISIEGSNESPSQLTFGSSWNLIYNGSCGLDVDPGRYSWGVPQWIVNNTKWYSSYRILVVSKRSTGEFVQYAEINLLAYYVD